MTSFNYLIKPSLIIKNNNKNKDKDNYKYIKKFNNNKYDI